MKTNQLTLTASSVRGRLVVVPDWIEKVLVQAEAAGRLVDYTELKTFVGTYPRDVKVSEIEAWHQ